MTRLTAYVPQDEVPVVLSPEASTVLLERLLEEAGGTVIHGATVVVFEETDRQDVVIFADGKVREIGRHHGEKMAAQRIVDAANGRRRGPGKLEDRDEHRPMLPEGTLDEPHPDAPIGPWEPYLVEGSAPSGEGTWMCWDPQGQRFDARFTWASRANAVRRTWWLDAHTDAHGHVEASPATSSVPLPEYH